ncbi:MAG: hypothetical protein ACOYEC_03515 [Christensenellales bacterium]|jgi:hypothetical protein|nr:hypothetical protein [Clostridiales bacterium]
MKKFFAVTILLALVCFAFTACNSPTPPGSSWADKEILTYEVKRGEEDLGVLTAITERNPSDKTIGGKSYPAATTRYTISYSFGDTQIETVALLKDFTPLASYKKITGAKNYELTAYYEGKYYHYTLANSEQSSGKIKVKGETIDNELLYTYIRCQNLKEGINKALNIPDAFTDKLEGVSVVSQGTEKLSVPYPDQTKTADCYKIAIVRNSTPIGKPIYVYYTPDNSENTIIGGLGSMNNSTKVPVKIVENDITYTIKSISVL